MKKKEMPNLKKKKKKTYAIAIFLFYFFSVREMVRLLFIQSAKISLYACARFIYNNQVLQPLPEKTKQNICGEIVK